MPALVTSMSKAALAGLCWGYALSLKSALAGCTGPEGAPLDGARLLWAMSGRESSFGQNMTPRHEPAYDVGGRYWESSQEVKQGCSVFGRDFACSYGPLQVLAVNAKGWSPKDLGADPAHALAAACTFLRSYVLEHQRAKTLAEICQCWNGGHVGAPTTPHYVDAVTGYYIAGIPTTF